MSRRETIRNGVRAAITGFVALLLIIVTLGWIWTAQHQAPALSRASHIVLSIAAVAGLFAVAKIWRDDAPDSRR
jgi:membrane protein YdbS with pleckstrin-like domain